MEPGSLPATRQTSDYIPPTTKAPLPLPPLGLEQVPRLLPGPAPPQLKAPLPAPQPIRPAAGALQHKPVGKRCNHPRQQAQQAGTVLPTTEVTTKATTEIDDDVDSCHCLNMTLETNVLRFAVNERTKLGEGCATTFLPLP